MADFFTEEVSRAYDERNRKLAPISENMHFLMQIILKDAPRHARVLCVGVGTGAEIFSLAKHYPDWTFVGVDPSAAMLDVCRKRLVEEGLMHRCELVQGYVEDVAEGAHFDVVLSVLVAHFINEESRAAFYGHMWKRLREGGYFMNTEISFDLDSAAFPHMLKNWEQVQTLMGATAESLKGLPDRLRKTLSILPPNKVEDLLRASGIAMPISFFQAFMIRGWYGQKEA